MIFCLVTALDFNDEENILSEPLLTHVNNGKFRY